MKKRLISLFLVVCLIASMATIAYARASSYLNTYSAGITAEGDGVISVQLLVNAVHTMDRVGVVSIQIQEKNSESSSWHHYQTVLGSGDPDEFYAYDTITFLNRFYFDCTPGRYYRAIAVVYAGDETGADTGTITSGTLLCK